VIAINSTHDMVSTQLDDCTYANSAYSGQQSVAVLNTGSASVSVVQIGDETFPSGTIAVGNQPVAAALSTSKLLYVANYGDGTISEVDTTNLIQNRTLAVVQHPTSVAFDPSGTLWVGGQGSICPVSISNWSVGTCASMDGTVTQIGFSASQNLMVQTLLQNGTPSSPSQGATMNAAISFASSGQSSYSTVNLVNTSTGVSSGPVISLNSNTAFVQSGVASSLAFPAQTALVPSVLSSSGITGNSLSSVSGDVVAVATGNTFTVSSLPSGEQLLSGTLPYPVRGVAIGGGIIYFTMTESNSVVSIPFSF